MSTLNKLTTRLRTLRSALQKHLSARAGRINRGWALTWVIAIYITVFGVYVVTNLDILFDITIVTGAALAFLIPELAKRRSLLFRLSLTCVPIASLAIAGRISEHKTDRDITALQLNILQLQETKESDLDILQQQSKYTERIIVNAGSAADQMKDADFGFSWKSKFLTLGHLLQETILLKENPSIREQFISVYDSTGGDDMKVYQALASQDVTPLFQAVQEIISTIKGVTEYNELARFVAKNMNYYSEANIFAIGGDTQRASERLRAISADLRTRRLGLTGGYYSHLGMLALGSNRKEEAFGVLYQGLTVDGSHIPLYEGLAYALWAFNTDVQTALAYVVKGMDLTTRTETCSFEKV